jgi:small subunit ribosomal protein S17
MEQQVNRSLRKSLTGVVVSRSGNKTVKVIYYYKRPHPLYKKETKRRTVIHVHDELNNAKVGDVVQVMQTRPLSKTKCWVILNTVNAIV